MPDTGTAFLADPMGHAPEALTPFEFEAVRHFLKLQRNDNEEPLRDAVSWLLSGAVDKPGMDDKAVFGRFLFHYANEVDCCGVLAQLFGSSSIEDLASNHEAEVLQWTLTAIRAGGWFAEWLPIQVCSIACNPTEPDSRFPSPLQIAATLTDWIKEHEDRMDAARDMVRQRPDLLFPATAESPATPEPPAAPETTTRPTSKPAKAQGARKPRKKAAHA
jgi:hypothetical protein